MKVKVFYSWQSDTKSGLNRSFIENALKDAVQHINEAEIEIEFALDRDTQNVPGTPSIADTILSKIDECQIFVGDLTLVTQIHSNRPSPNPNVLLELGYAVGKKGWDCIINVMNEANGSAELLPFDLRHRRWPIRYKLSDETSSRDKLNQRSVLTNQIQDALKSVITTGVLYRNATIAIQSRRHEIDCAIYNQIKECLGDSEAINFLRKHDFGDAFRTVELVPVREFIHLCEKPEMEFSDEMAEKLKTKLVTKTKQFLELLGVHSFRHPAPHLADWRTIKGDDFYEDSKAQKAARELNAFADEVVKAYDDFVKHARFL